MEEDSAWEFNAPRYFDFALPIENDDKADEYFNTDHGNVNPQTSSSGSSYEVVSIEEVRVSLEGSTETFYTPHVRKNSVQVNRPIQVTIPITPNVLKRVPRERNRKETVNWKQNYAGKRVKVALNRMVYYQSAKKDFSKMLRNTDKNLVNYHPTRTIPQPFLFHGKPKEETRKEKVLTLAEKCLMFTGGANLRSNTDPSVSREGKLKLTRPVSPKLTKTMKNKSENVLSHSEMEEKEWKEACKNQFKASEVNKKILERPHLPAKIPSKPTTVVKEFDLTKATNKTNKSLLETPPNQFKANPIPAGILRGPVGVGARKEMPITVPMSPAFSKLHATKKKETMLDESQVICDSRRTVTEKDCTLRVTQPVPFSFAGKEHEAQDKRKMMLEMEEKKAKEARQFIANPLPDLSASPTLPCKKSRPSTTVEPFDFPGEKRSQENHQRWKERMELMEKHEREMKEFRARPASVLNKHGWVPEKSVSLLSVLTDTRNVPSNTEKRAEERREWQVWMEQKEHEAEEEKKKREEEEKKEEDREMHVRRKQTVHQAQPIRHYNPIVLKLSERPITIPHSPHFSQRISSKYLDKGLKEDQ